ncbi:hypothetical protein Q4491_12730 [Photobacterium sp. 2_MG-2023]|uniref:hypothetical protein n=1 Tax=Photobacterium sp. 2_MG-2023 TaxID=3062663 RepID=UPI0026E12F33|nr:hypothetical protein [Photobacterium sp. 2_MG-2023]MDO6582205.1 hypothetical protein [Photobacterium sp. 2_MG-2023]
MSFGFYPAEFSATTTPCPRAERETGKTFVFSCRENKNTIKNQYNTKTTLDFLSDLIALPPSEMSNGTAFQSNPLDHTFKVCGRWCALVCQIIKDPA